MYPFSVFVLFSVLSLNYGTSYKIVGVFPHFGKSHLDTFTPVMKGLAEKGHDVTVISFFSTNFNLTNYREVIIDNLEETIKSLNSFIDLTFFEKWQGYERLIQYFTILQLSSLAEKSCEAAYSSKSVQNFLKEHHSFDVMVVEMFNTNCMLPLAKRFNSALVGIHSATVMPWSWKQFGNPNNPGYIVDNSLAYSDKMPFLGRVENTLVTIFHKIIHEMVMLPSDRWFVDKYLGEDNLLEDCMNKCNVLLVNTHFSLNLPYPLVPGIIEIGGIHIGKNRPLPMNLEKWISEAKHGVIYFSLGSMIKAKTMRKEKLEAFNKAFKRLPQRVLWKWENDTMEGKADNVMIQKWMPQFDILSHPNVKAFINHGGLLGTIEAVHCGVPMVVMPQFGDQHTNAKAIEANGGGIILKMSEVTEETVYNSLKQVLSPDFQQQAKELSERFKDRPLPPLETAIYWVEYVARHKGAPHMRTAAVGMPFYQYYLLDVIGFLLIVTGLLSYILYHILKYPVRGLMRNKTVKEKSS